MMLEVGCDAKNGEVHAATGSKSPSGSSPERVRYNCALVHGAREEVVAMPDKLHPAHLSSHRSLIYDHRMAVLGLKLATGSVARISSPALPS